MHDHDAPPELLYNGSGNSLAAILALQSDRRFFDAAGRLAENLSESGFTKKGFVDRSPQQKPIRRTRTS